MSDQPKRTLKDWANDDKPREKLILKGKASLSDAELIAILIGTGNQGETVIALSQRILQSSNNNLIELSRLSMTDLMKFRGIGEAKAISIIAAIELGKRRRSAEARERKTITSSKDAYDQLYAVSTDLDYEKFWVMLLDQANKVIRTVEVSEGGTTGTVADPKKIFKIALEANACNIILCHNHPSGQLKPSKPDIAITEKIKHSGNLLDIKVLDHLIIGHDGFFSFADEGLL